MLTTQRLAVLDVLAHNRFVKTAQFYELLRARTATQERGVRRILYLMAKDRLIDRRYVIESYDTNGRPHGQNTHWLLSKGRQAIGRGQATAEKASTFLEHDTLVTAFHLALAREAPKHLRIHWRQDSLKHTVNPDALLALENTERVPRERSTNYFLIEVERTRQALSRTDSKGVIAKLKKYGAYSGSERVTRDYSRMNVETQRAEWHFTRFRTIWLVPASGRHSSRELVDNLLTRLAGAFPSSAIWIATADEAIANPFGAIYRTPKDYQERSYSLGDL